MSTSPSSLLKRSLASSIAVSLASLLPVSLLTTVLSSMVMSSLAVIGAHDAVIAIIAHEAILAGFTTQYCAVVTISASYSGATTASA